MRHVVRLCCLLKPPTSTSGATSGEASVRLRFHPLTIHFETF